MAGQRSMTTVRPASRARCAAASSITPSCSQTPRAPRALARRLVDHAQLQPDAAGAQRDRLVDVRARPVAAAEDVDDLDAGLGRDRLQARVAALAEDLVGAWVDRDDAEAAALQQGRDAVRVAS